MFREKEGLAVSHADDFILTDGVTDAKECQERVESDKYWTFDPETKQCRSFRTPLNICKSQRPGWRYGAIPEEHVRLILLEFCGRWYFYVSQCA